jgi:hypothetical protein
MDFESESGDILPKQRQRYPIIYLVIHRDEKGELIIHEAEHRRAAKMYVNKLPNPESVEFLYRVSAKIPLKRKIVMSF